MNFYTLARKKKAELPWTRGIMAAYEHSDSITFGHVILPKGSAVPEHQHDHEQWTYVISGKLQFTVDHETEIMDAGMLVKIPSNATHSAIALEECEVIDIFNPQREDYLQLGT